MLSYLWKGSPNFGYPRGTHGQNRPRAIIWHITASRPTTPPLAGLDSWFGNPAAGSTQLGIQDREVHQYVQFDDACWGAGYLDRPDISNPHIYRWWNSGINPNTESVQVEVISLPGLNEVKKGQHRVNAETWETMKLVGSDLVERFEEIELVAFDFIAHHQVDSVSRARDTKTVYWPIDIMEEIINELEEEDDMAAILFTVKLASQQTWLVDGKGFSQRVLAPEPLEELRKEGIAKEGSSIILSRDAMILMGIPESELP